MSTHDEIVAQMEIYVTENNKFVEKGIKSSATRARKALSEIAKLAKARRAEITDEKDAMDKEKDKRLGRKCYRLLKEIIWN